MVVECTVLWGGLAEKFVNGLGSKPPFSFQAHLPTILLREPVKCRYIIHFFKEPWK